MFIQNPFFTNIGTPSFSKLVELTAPPIKYQNNQQDCEPNYHQFNHFMSMVGPKATQKHL
jgi:hypothetical protein